MVKPILYERALSSSSFRIRIAFKLANVEFAHVSVTAAESRASEYRVKNPQGLVPLLVHGEEHIAQSIAILEYIVEQFPAAANLLPKDPSGRARVRSIAQYIVSEIQPLANTRLDKFMDEQNINIKEFKQHWVKEGLKSIEAMLAAPQTGSFSHGDSPTIADCCLIPQVYNAIERMGIDISDLPITKKIYEHAKAVPAFQQAWPNNQPDFEQEQ